LLTIESSEPAAIQSRILDVIGGSARRSQACHGAPVEPGRRSAWPRSMMKGRADGRYRRDGTYRILDVWLARALLGAKTARSSVPLKTFMRRMFGKYAPEVRT
jgi:hypothetical protein